MAISPTVISDDIAAWAVSSLLVSLRVAPVFAFAPPFTLTRVPGVFRALFGLSVAGTLVAAAPALRLADLSVGAITAAGLQELMVGAIFVAAFQIAYAGLYFAGRTIDIQAGFGLAGLIDPSSQSQTPLVGTLFVYAAAAVFFALGGDLGLLAH